MASALSALSGESAPASLANAIAASMKGATGAVKWGVPIGGAVARYAGVSCAAALAVVVTLALRNGTGGAVPPDAPAGQPAAPIGRPRPEPPAASHALNAVLDTRVNVSFWRDRLPEALEEINRVLPHEKRSPYAMPEGLVKTPRWGIAFAVTEKPVREILDATAVL